MKLLAAKVDNMVNVNDQADIGDLPMKHLDKLQSCIYELVKTVMKVVHDLKSRTRVKE